MKYIFSFDEISYDKINLAGGKGTSLVKLKRAGLNVPDGHIIISDAFEDGRIINQAEEELKILTGRLSDKITYAVRSSALNEDGENASFAGAYETVTDVKKEDIQEAVRKVSESAQNIRVKKYARDMQSSESCIAVVIQRFIKADFSGVLFTSDVISGSSAKMQGNYVCGCGENLVSGSINAENFYFDAMKYSYSGKDEIRPYARALYKSAVKIKRLNGCAMDIEWAAAGGRIYILQARPVTTLRRLNYEKYEINGSLSGEYIFTKTNVGEIFLSTVSPVTFSLLELICDMMGIPCFIDNICGQAYFNLSVICSMLMSLGLSKKKAFSRISDIAGKIPEGVEITVFPFDKKYFIQKILALTFTGKKKSSFKMSKTEFIEKIPELADKIIAGLRSIDSNEALLEYWNTTCCDFANKVLSSISVLFPVIKPFLNTGKMLSEAAGDELAAELCAGSMGILESMKPLLMLEDVIEGKASREDYIKQCGHRSVYEMELAEPFPYESEEFPDNLIKEHIKSGVNVHKMQFEREQLFEQSVTKFKSLYPNKSRWLDKTLKKFSNANHIRENIRSKAVRLFCILREFLLKAAELNGTGNDIFMLYFPEVMKLLSGDRKVLESIPHRKESYEKYRSYPAFPNIILGRFEPETWLKMNNRRLDFYSATSTPSNIPDIKGFAGAAGIITGRVRVITDLSQADTLEKGEILITTATNIGWTIIFPKAAAIVTDIGAPLSHAAIVAREFGIPAVVGCGNATTLLRTGDLICVDGSCGTVEKLSEDNFDSDKKSYLKNPL